jgi:hypothetical protein
MENKEILNENSIIIGCNYHLKWQSNKRMRFVLTNTNEKYALMETRITKSKFWTKKEDLIFIMSDHNIHKAKKILYGKQG